MLLYENRFVGFCTGCRTKIGFSGFHSPVYVFTKGFHLAELRWVVVIEGVDGHAVVELLDVVRTLRAQIVNLVVVLKTQSLRSNVQ